MEKITAKTMLEIVAQQWASTKDIMIIGACGKNKALIIKRDIKSSLEAQGYYLPKNLVPMEKVIDYFKININYLRKVKGNNENEKNL